MWASVARRSLVGALALGGLVLNLVLVAGGVDNLITRNVIVLWLPAALMVAGGLGARRAGLLGVAGAVALCAIGIVAAVGSSPTATCSVPIGGWWRGPWAPAPPGGQRAMLVQHYRDLLPLSLYLPGLRFMPRAGTRVRELDVVSISAPGSPCAGGGRPATSRHRRSRAPTRSPAFTGSGAARRISSPWCAWSPPSRCR